MALNMSCFQRRLLERFRRYRKTSPACRSFRSMRASSGASQVVLSASYSGLENISVSTSHDGDYAMAFAIVMQR
jgi:phosphopantetheinyl transferase (holo-ACP synthase)